MEHAWKRGRRCRVLRISGVCWQEGAARNDVQRAAIRFTREVLAVLGEVDPAESFEAVRERVRDLVAQARAAEVPEGYLTSYDEEVRGLDAPRPVLTVGVPGRWGASADETGIILSAYDDPNEWRECTHGQTAAVAYAIAARVWPQVQQAATLHEAASILRQAGARLHGWCGLD
jgi:hypothetical protein